ncbi:MAG: ABC-type transport auxiliary lipoprotein family protein [Pseudomonadota bacterium]
MTNSTQFVSTSASGIVVWIALMLCGCSLLTPAKSPPPIRYSFESASFDSAASAIAVQSIPSANEKIHAPTLVIGSPRAAPGFDSHQMAYIRLSHRLEYFRQSEWIAAPASMLAPIIAAALERSGQFSAVVHAPTSIVGQLRLDVEIVRLQQEFFKLPSQVHFTLRAHLLDASTRQVIAWHEFDSLVAAASEDPYGGVIATNTVIRNVMKELADFCVLAVNEQKKLSKDNSKTN